LFVFAFKLHKSDKQFKNPGSHNKSTISLIAQQRNNELYIFQTMQDFLLNNEI